jgi:hypothetical protein
MNSARFDMHNHRSFVDEKEFPGALDLLRRHIEELTARQNHRPPDTRGSQWGTQSIQPLVKRKRHLRHGRQIRSSVQQACRKMRQSFALRVTPSGICIEQKE